MRALLIVAHPDDDAIFAGPLQIAMPWLKWQAVCATYPENSTRAGEMKHWQKQINGASPVFLNFPDDPGDLKRKASSFSTTDIRSSLQSLGPDCDLLVTHDVAGEYGHPHHVAVARGVREAFPDRPLLSFAHFRKDPDFRVEVADFSKAAMAAYRTEWRVVRHFHRKLRCCRVGRYRNEQGSPAISGPVPSPSQVKAP